MDPDTQKHKSIKIHQSQMKNHLTFELVEVKVLFRERSAKMVDSSEEQKHWLASEGPDRVCELLKSVVI